MATQPDTRERILAAALDLFCRLGYTAVGTQEICDAAGVLKGSMYHFFRSKLEIALAALTHFGESSVEDFAGIASGPGTPAEKVLAIFEMEYGVAVRQKAKHGRVYGCFLANASSEMAPKDDSVRSCVHRLYGLWHEAIRPIFAESQKKSTALDQARMLFAVMNGSILAAIVANDPEQIRKLGRQAPKLFGFAAVA